jgi:hypothetical protein
MRAELSLEIGNAGGIAPRIFGRRQQLQPNCILSQPAQSQHPLERDGKVAAALKIFRRKAAAEKHRHERENGFAVVRGKPAFMDRRRDRTKELNLFLNLPWRFP